MALSGLIGDDHHITDAECDLLPGVESFDEAEADARQALDKLEAEWTLRSPLPPRARRKAGALPLFDDEQSELFGSGDA